MGVVIQWGSGSGIQYDESPLLLGDEDFVLPGSTPTTITNAGGIASAASVGAPTLTEQLSTVHPAGIASAGGVGIPSLVEQPHIPGPWDVDADVEFLVTALGQRWQVDAGRYPLAVALLGWRTVTATLQGDTVHGISAWPTVQWTEGNGVVMNASQPLVVR